MKSSPLLVECLHVCQQQSSLWKCFRALGTLACLQLITMLACSVLLILPFHVKNLMAFFAGKTPAVGCIAVTTAINMCARLVYYCGVIGLCPLCRRAPPPPPMRGRSLFAGGELRKFWIPLYWGVRHVKWCTFTNSFSFSEQAPQQGINHLCDPLQ